jgi:hypothetical protein
MRIGNRNLNRFQIHTAEELSMWLCAAGLVVIGVGAHIQIAASHYLDFLADSYLNTPIFIIIAGETSSSFRIQLS